MIQALCLAGVLAAHLGGGAEPAVVQLPDGGTVAIGAAGFPTNADGKVVPGNVTIEMRHEYGSPVLRDIPYVNRLFRNVGWSRTSVAILPPLKAGERSRADAPTRTEILHALPALTRVPGMYKESRDDVDIKVEKVVDRVDPPRFFPLVGPAQLRHLHWKCTVHFTENIELTNPVAFRTSRKRAEVVYIDKDCLHLCAAKEEVNDTQPPVRVTACWDSHVSGSPALLTGSVYLFCDHARRPIEANGQIEVVAFDMGPALKGEQPTRLAKWTFDPDTLKKLKRTDRIGTGYTLALPWDHANAKNIKLQTTYVPAQSQRAAGAPTYLTLQSADSGIVQAAARETKAVPAQTVSRSASAAAGDFVSPAVLGIVRMHKAGLSKEIILQQAAIDNALGRLPVGFVSQAKEGLRNQGTTVFSVDDLIHLKEEGVPDEIISALHADYVRQMGRSVSGYYSRTRY